MSKRTTDRPTDQRARRARTTAVTTATNPNPTADVATADVATMPADIPPADVADVNPIDARIDTTFPGIDVPAFIRAMAHAFAMVATMPTGTRTDRETVRDAIVAELVARMGDRAVPVSRTVGRFSNMHVFESQNSMYVAAAMSGVNVTTGMIVAAWRADLPSAKCDYIGTAYDRDYPSSTMSDYIGARHGIVPNVPGARDVVAAWRTTRNRKPADVPVTA